MAAARGTGAEAAAAGSSTRQAYLYLLVHTVLSLGEAGTTGIVWGLGVPVGILLHLVQLLTEGLQALATGLEVRLAVCPVALTYLHGAQGRFCRLCGWMGKAERDRRDLPVRMAVGAGGQQLLVLIMGVGMENL